MRKAWSCCEVYDDLLRNDYGTFPVAHHEHVDDVLRTIHLTCEDDSPIVVDELELRRSGNV